MRRHLLALLAALLLAPAWAATTAERSPFAQGHWWDSTRSGHGFEILNTAGQVVVVWYTYDEAGSPTWYYAQGALADLPSRALPLLQTRWADGRLATPTTVGALRLTVRQECGMAVVFVHAQLHEGAPVVSGRKYVWTDVMYAR